MINCGTKLDCIRDNILQLASRDDGASESSIAALTLLKEHLESLETERALRRRQAALIKSLYFPEIRQRWEGVADADELTITWLFDQSKTDFLDWLEKGHGIYWVAGKVRLSPRFAKTSY